MNGGAMENRTSEFRTAKPTIKSGFSDARMNIGRFAVTLAETWHLKFSTPYSGKLQLRCGFDLGDV